MIKTLNVVIEISRERDEAIMGEGFSDDFGIIKVKKN